MNFLELPYRLFIPLRKRQKKTKKDKLNSLQFTYNKHIIVVVENGRKWRDYPLNGGQINDRGISAFFG